MSGCHKIVQNGQPGVKLDVLECPRDAQFGNFVGWQSGDILSFKKNITLLRAIKSVYAVKEAALPSAIRAYNSQYLRPSDLNVNIIQSTEPPKVQTDSLDFQLDPILPPQNNTPEELKPR
jgi:hypothetical protein